MTAQNQYKRVLLKLSGEMLGGDDGVGINGDALEQIATEIKSLHDCKVEVAIVIGGGNIWRGASAVKWDMDRTAADYMGMLATVINAMALQNILESKFDLFTRVMSAIHMQELAEPYIKRKAVKHLEKGRIVIFAGGTGNPFFTTDTAASLRAREIGADVIFKATKVDGIYDSDPTKNRNAKKFDELSYMDTVAKGLKIMDATALTLCMESEIPILVFKMESGALKKAYQGHQTGTIVR